MAKIRQIIIKNKDLKKLRKKAGLSQRQLGDLTGINFTLISKWENGYIMNEENWDKIVKILDKKIYEKKK